MEYESQLEESKIEQHDHLMVIKKEVLDLSDLADKLGGIIIAQNRKFEAQKKHLDEIATILPKYLKSEEIPPISIDQSEELNGDISK